MSRPGIPISPIEIRLTKDRLSLVARVLSNNADAYKHTQVILDLVHKLGFRNDVVAEVKTLAMLADTALQAEDYDSAYEAGQKMVETVQNLRQTIGTDDPAVVEASDVCWVTCFQIGRHPEFDDNQKKLALLGRAVELCPADRITDVLGAWHRVEDVDIVERKTRVAARQSGQKRDLNRPSRGRPTSQSMATSLTERLHHLHIPSGLPVNADAAALANKAFNKVAANFPFGVGPRGRSILSQERDRSRSSERSLPTYDGVEKQATRVLQKGLGWLLGDDE